MRVVELFSGCGGFSRGAKAAGFSVTVAYDNDQILSSSYSLNFPTTKHVLADVSDLSCEDIIRDAGGEVDGIFGAPPCQGFSSIGKKRPDDPRRLLVGHFFRLVKDVGPKFFIMENVLGLQQGSAKQVLRDAMKFVEEDYDISLPLNLDAAEFGAATKRRRIFIVGFRKDLRTSFSLKDLDPHLQPAASVEDAIKDLRNLTASNSEELKDTWIISPSACLSNYARRLRSDQNTTTGNIRTVHSERVIQRFASIAPGAIDKVGRHPRLKWDGQCPTLRAGTGSDRGSFQSVRPIHPDEPRVITVREAARLQGFPDCHFFHKTVWHSFRMIGNSVSPFVSEAVFCAIKACLIKAQKPEPLQLTALASSSESERLFNVAH